MKPFSGRRRKKKKREEEERALLGTGAGSATDGNVAGLNGWIDYFTLIYNMSSFGIKNSV